MAGTTTFPGAVDNFTDVPSGGTQDVTYGGRTHSAKHNDIDTAMEAVQTKVGTGASTPTANTVLRGTGPGASAFGQIQAGDITPGTATMLKIAQTVLGSATASITFSSIPGTYESLMLVVHGRGDNASQQVELWLRCNGDTAGNYLTEESAAQGAAHVASELASSKVRLGYLPAATSTASLFGANRLMIPGYSRTVGYKAMLAEGADAHVFTTNGYIRTSSSGWWLNTAAITQLQILLSAGNLIAGTVATLYGLPA
jgi:hypothetical protein